MSLNDLKCIFCEILPDCQEVYRCDQNHISCISCGSKHSFICGKCLQIFIEKIQNPVLMSLKNCRSLLPENCVYKESGCNLKFPSTYEVAVHIKQCQFRPYKCVGQTLKVWICTWSGLQDDLPSHFLSSHAALGNALPYLAHSFIPFKSDVTYSTLNLVDACGRKFVFYYNSNSNTQMVYFIIFLIGSKDEASQYVYEFEIKSPAEKYRKITVVEESVSDSQPKEEIFKHEKCVALSHMAIRNYLYEGNIHFRFTISKKEEIADKLSDKMLAEMTNVKLRTSHSVHSSTRKGKVSVNISKKNTEHTSVPLPLISSINKKPPPIILTGRSISLEPSMQECSSINKLSPSDNAISRGDQTPCLIASINKQESVDENFLRSMSIKRGHSSSIIEQPYKAIDNKIYNQKFPKNSLSKPMVKKT